MPGGYRPFRAGGSAMFQRIVFSAFIITVLTFAVGAQSAADSLSRDEIDGLLLMREEEKLARDVYLTLGEMWNLRVFNNISKSEQVHMDHMKELLEAFNITDPVKNESDIGNFKDPKLTELYDELIERGSKSQYEALLVGRDIEELDIDDLQSLMDKTENQMILSVYDDLLRGSENHLDAFNRQLARYK